MQDTQSNTAQPKVQVSDILSRFGQQYRRHHKLSEQHRKVLFAVEACRSAAMGAHMDVCDQCQHQRITYNSCRNRHCPKCQLLNKEKWVDKLSCTLLPVRYFHVVFTLPAELNRLCLVNQQVLYDLLFASASASILTLAKDPKRTGVYTGLVALLHTWGQTLTEHPHLHTMVPAGGWSAMNGYWKNSSKKFFLPVKVVSRLFRGKFLAGLKNAYENKQLKFAGSLKELKSRSAFNQFLQGLYQKDWVVYTKAPFKNTSGILKYLGNYSHRIAISNHRIVSMDDNTVTFRYKDYKDRSRSKTMTLQASEFIRRFLLHVLPPGYCKIRYYGLLSSHHRQKLLLSCRKAMGIQQQKSRIEGMTWQEVLKMLTGYDVTVCPCCNKGVMQPYIPLPGERSPPC